MRSCREPSGADLKHSIISSLVIFRLLGSLSALGSPHAAKRFIGLAIGVRTRSRALLLLVRHHALILLRHLLCFSLYPQINPQIGERKKQYFRQGNPIFFFVFNELGPVHTPTPAPEIGGGDLGVSALPSIWDQNPRLGPALPSVRI